MAEDIAREIIAQPKPKLAFLFGVVGGYSWDSVLLYASKDAHGKMLYHVCPPPTPPETPQSDGIGPYEIKYADLESATDSLRAFLRCRDTPVYLVLHSNHENKKVASLGKVGTDKLSSFLQDKMKSLDAIGVEENAEALRG